MKWALGLAVVCFGCVLAISLASPGHSTPVFFGMLGPLSAVAGTWLLIERTFRVNPGALTALMMTAFLVKMVFFGGYVVAVVTLAKLDATVFAISFAGYFIALYGVEAWLLRRLTSRLT
jgi:hypothetical protein